jgi:hypothetical protein
MPTTCIDLLLRWATRRNAAQSGKELDLPYGAFQNLNQWLHQRDRAE